MSTKRSSVDSRPPKPKRRQAARATGQRREAGDKQGSGGKQDSADSREPRPPKGGADKPVVRFINELLLEAVRRRASDIHFEPFQHQLRIRFRVDGVLHTTRVEGPEMARGVTSRIKIMAGLNIAERRIPQDGHTTLTVPPSRAIDVRVSTIPAVWGEKTVLRLLDASHTNLSIDQLGLFERQKRHLLEALRRRQGLILVTGPTGSGKTQTVYAGLNRLNKVSRNIATVEDPVEIRLDGVNQVQVNPRIGLDFASTLRAMLRQDPDVLLVGEIRDRETADIALRAAHTGHLVLSTLHTNSAAETLSRLLSMGIPPFNLATATRMIVAQRLVRRLCRHCKKSVPAPQHIRDIMNGVPQGQETQKTRETQQMQQVHQAKETWEAQREQQTQEAWKKRDRQNGQESPEKREEQLNIYEPGGCEHCLVGYHGRVGVYEVVPVSRAMSEIIMQGGSVLALEAQMRNETLLDLQQAALHHVAAGDTSMAEATGLL